MTSRAELTLRFPRERLFWKFVTRHEIGCWEWIGQFNSYGYGICARTIDGKLRKFMAHRASYQLSVGPIPEGYQIDHLCRNTRCVRPDHLEAVTPRVNVLRSESPSAKAARSETCSKGHTWDGRRRTRNGKPAERWCSTCATEKNRRWYAQDRIERGRTTYNGNKTHCKRGHEFTAENTRIMVSGHRNCRECQRMHGRKVA